MTDGVIPDVAKGRVLSEQDVVEEVSQSVKSPNEPRPRRPFAWMLESRRGTSTALFVVVVAMALIFFAVFAVVTFVTMPTVEQVVALVPASDTIDRLQAFKDLRAAWMQQTTTLGQLLVFGSLIPVLTTIIGYALGNRGKGD